MNDREVMALKHPILLRAERAEARIEDLEIALKYACRRLEFYGQEAQAVNAWNMGKLEPLASVSDAGKTLGTAVPEREPEILNQTGATVGVVEEPSGKTEARPNQVASSRPSSAGEAPGSPPGPLDRSGEGARGHRTSEVRPEWTDPSDTERARLAFDLQLTQRMPEVEAVILKMLEAVYRSAPAVPQRMTETPHDSHEAMAGARRLFDFGQIRLSPCAEKGHEWGTPKCVHCGLPQHSLRRPWSR